MLESVLHLSCVLGIPHVSVPTQGCPSGQGWVWIRGQDLQPVLQHCASPLGEGHLCLTSPTT